MKRLKLVAVLSVFVAAMVSSVLPARAQQNTSNGFLVTPVREELTIDPGKSGKVTLSVTNATNTQTTAKAVINDFEPSQDESGQPRILLDDTKSNVNSFKDLVAPIPSFQLAPRERKDIDVRITVPSNASGGGYYGVIRFIADSNGQDNNVALAASVGTIFLVTVPGDLQQSLQFKEFTAAQNNSAGRFFFGTGPISLITRLENTGNIHVKPFGKVQVKDRGGKVVEEFEFNNTEPRTNVLPKSTRKFTNELKNDYGFGKYTIVANLGYGDGGNLISATNTFWIIPMWIVVLFFVLIIVLLVGGFVIFRKMRGPKKHKASVRR